MRVLGGRKSGKINANWSGNGDWGAVDELGGKKMRRKIKTRRRRRRWWVVVVTAGCKAELIGQTSCPHLPSSPPSTYLPLGTSLPSTLRPSIPSPHRPSKHASPFRTKHHQLFEHLCPITSLSIWLPTFMFSGRRIKEKRKHKKKEKGKRHIRRIRKTRKRRKGDKYQLSDMKGGENQATSFLVSHPSSL